MGPHRDLFFGSTRLRRPAPGLQGCVFISVNRVSGVKVAQKGFNERSFISSAMMWHLYAVTKTEIMKKIDKYRVENRNRSHRTVETAQEESQGAAARGVVTVSETIMVTFEITGVMYEGLSGPGCLLLHV